MGELFTHPRIRGAAMDRVPLDVKRESQYLLQDRDLLFARQSLVLKGAGKCSIFFTDHELTTFESHVIRVRLNSSLADPLYYYYYWQSHQGQSGIRSIVEQGAGASGIRATDLAKLPVAWRPLAEQRAIAHILGTLDDKIELNRRMNETLEAIARALFKSWFVDFEPVRAKMAGHPIGLPSHLAKLFPSTLDDQGKPKGWRSEKLDRLFDVSIGRTPPRKERHHFLPGGMGETWLSIKAMGTTQAFATASDEDLTSEAVERFRVPLIPAGTVMVSFKLTVGRVAIAAGDMYSNEAIAHLRPRRDTPVTTAFTYCYMKGFDYDTLGSTSSIATAVNSKSIKAVEMLLPEAATLAAFEAVARPIFARILRVTRQTDALVRIREELLPRLVSGELRVPDAERVAAAVV